MIFKIRRTSGESVAKYASKLLSYNLIQHSPQYHTITLKSLQDLVDLMSAIGRTLVLERDGNEAIIEIYDDYRE